MQYEQTLNLPNTVVRIIRPELTEEERNKRQKRIKEAATNLLRSVNK